MTTPAVSVVLPTHDRAGVLPRAVQTVLDQTFDDFELLIVDDGSTDATPAVLAGLSDPRIRVLRKPRNEGAARARNLGIREARAPLVAFQDSDDEWLPRKLERQVALMRASPADVGWVGGGYRMGERTVLSQPLVEGAGYDGELLAGAPFVTPTWLVRREHLLEFGGFDESLPCLEDWDLIFRLADCCRLRSVAEPVLVRHGSPDSLFGNVDKRRVGLEVILTRHAQRWQSAPRLHAMWCAELGRLHGLNGDRGASRAWLARSFARSSERARVGLLYLAALAGAPALRRLSRTRLAPALSL